MPAPESERRGVGTTRDPEPTTPTFEVDLRAPALPASLDLVQDLVARLYERVGDELADTDRIRFETALVEVVGNIIEHGLPVAGHTVTLHVTLTWRESNLLAVMTDNAGPVDVRLDPAAAMSPVDSETGRGLAMALALSDELAYERRGNTNRWIVRCGCGR